MIVVNVFAIVSASLFFAKKISPLAFLLSSVLWFALMITFWFILPKMIYKKSATFQDSFKITLGEDAFTIQNDKGGRSWPWKDLSTWMENPFFFYLYFDARSFFIIPKEAFDGEELTEARKILFEKIPRKKK